MTALTRRRIESSRDLADALAASTGREHDRIVREARLAGLGLPADLAGRQPRLGLLAGTWCGACCAHRPAGGYCRHDERARDDA